MQWWGVCLQHANVCNVRVIRIPTMRVRVTCVFNGSAPPSPFRRIQGPYLFIYLYIYIFPLPRAVLPPDPGRRRRRDLHRRRPPPLGPAPCDETGPEKRAEGRRGAGQAVHCHTRSACGPAGVAGRLSRGVSVVARRRWARPGGPVRWWPAT
jgi:hypothetical protein